MKNSMSILLFTLATIHLCSQTESKRIALKEGINEISYQDVAFQAILIRYNEKSAAHLVGDVSLSLEHKDKRITTFYVSGNETNSKYLHRGYQNLFLTFLIEGNTNILTAEEAKFDRIFTLLNNQPTSIGDGALTLEITDSMHEWGYTGPPDDENRTYFSNVLYTLQISLPDTEEIVNFYSSDIKQGYSIDTKDHTIEILSDLYKNDSCLLEMIVRQK